MAETNGQTHGHGDSMTNMAQWGRVVEKYICIFHLIFLKKKRKKSYVALVYVNCGDRPWVTQSFCVLIFFRKITWYLKKKYLGFGLLSDTPTPVGALALTGHIII